MTHEPECPAPMYADVVPLSQRDRVVDLMCRCDILRLAYRRGYNDHARSQQHWQDTHGAYRQHGEGENP